MIEATFLVAVNGIVRRVEIQDNPSRRRRMGIEIELDEQPLDRLCVMTNPQVAARRTRRRVLQTIERALAGKHRAILALRLQLVRQQGQDRIVAQLVVVVEILVSERNLTDPLADQGGKLMHNQLRRPVIDEAECDTIKQSDRPVAMAQQQRAGLRADRPAIERRHNPALEDALREEVLPNTNRY